MPLILLVAKSLESQIVKADTDMQLVRKKDSISARRVLCKYKWPIKELNSVRNTQNNTLIRVKNHQKGRVTSKRDSTTSIWNKMVLKRHQRHSQVKNSHSLKEERVMYLLRRPSITLT